MASLDLSGTDVVVLSECETGIGKAAAGEGALGLQRAFQVSGARTTVTSLWSVPDEATQLLMRRFYENLWAGNLTKLEALRQAQIALLGDPALAALRRSGARGWALGAEEAKDASPARLPAYFWAASVLSGDWR